ncbi:MAG: biotin transporter BioY [Candidatus Melainabacteria bacterium]|nr:biotin transporter BioY [Candidatus Melainabacteria bacterium]
MSSSSLPPNYPPPLPVEADSSPVSEPVSESVPDSESASVLAQAGKPPADASAGASKPSLPNMSARAATQSGLGSHVSKNQSSSLASASSTSTTGAADPLAGPTQPLEQDILFPTAASGSGKQTSAKGKPGDHTALQYQNPTRATRPKSSQATPQSENKNKGSAQPPLGAKATPSGVADEAPTPAAATHSGEAAHAVRFRLPFRQHSSGIRLIKKSRPSLDTQWQKYTLPPRAHSTRLLLGVFAGVLLAALAFVSVPVPNVFQAIQTQGGAPWLDVSPLHPPAVTFHPVVPYSLQLPVALALGALLGPLYATVVVAVYMLAGLLGLPVLGQGGGWDYLQRPGVAYYAAMMAGAWWTGAQYGVALRAGRHWLLWPFVAMGLALLCVLLTHGMAALLLGGVLLAQPSGFSLDAWLHWLGLLSATPLFYDVATCWLLFMGVRLLRRLLRPLLY